MPCSTASRWREPSATATPTSPRATARAIIAWCAVESSTMPFDLGLVRVGGEQLVEVLGAEQPGQHLAVQLHEQRVAARPGDQRVELAVEPAELGELHARVELVGDRLDLGTVGVGGTRAPPAR